MRRRTCCCLRDHGPGGRYGDFHDGQAWVAQCRANGSEVSVLPCAMVGGGDPYVARYAASPRSPIPPRESSLVATPVDAATCEVLNSRCGVTLRAVAGLRVACRRTPARGGVGPRGRRRARARPQVRDTLGRRRHLRPTARDIPCFAGTARCAPSRATKRACSIRCGPTVRGPNRRPDVALGAKADHDLTPLRRTAGGLSREQDAAVRRAFARHSDTSRTPMCPGRPYGPAVP